MPSLDSLPSQVYIEAMEDGRFSDLPGPTYAVGFVRAYADYHVLVVSNKSGTYEPTLPPSRGDFVQNMIDAWMGDEENFISTSDVLGVAKACLMAEASAHQSGAFLRIT